MENKAFLTFHKALLWLWPERHLTSNTLWDISADDNLVIFFLFISTKQDLVFHANWRQFAWNVKSCLLGKICCLLKFLPRVLRVKVTQDQFTYEHQMGRVKRKKCLRACAKCADSDHSAHAQSLIRAFALHCNILRYSMILFLDCEGPDQTAHAHSLIWAFAVRIRPKTRFRLARPK